jgi:8-amino-7-oxononanoate synthase
MLHIATELARLRGTQLYRRREILDGPQGVEAQVGGETLLTFCSNDYLGLANHPAVVTAFKAGADLYGVGAGASHLLGGHSAAHHALEEELAAFVGCERALLFSTGYMANLGVVTALIDRHATLFEDKLNHASLIDAARLSQAKVRRYAHADTGVLQALLAAADGKKLIMSDGVFSMDGDIAPLPVLIALAEKSGALLLIDDAHGLGVLGEGGRGMFEHHGITPHAPAILMGTLGKAFGSFGAFVAGSEELIEFLIQQARTYIYTTALPPAVAEATRASLRVVQAESWRREHLKALVARFRSGAAALGLKLLPSSTPIQPLILGESAQALAASRQLRARGILIPAIRPPTVPAHSARLRITFSAAHSLEQVDRLLEALAALKLPAETG